MADLVIPPGNELRTRRKLFNIGCVANILLFVLMIAICVVFLLAIVRTLDEGSTSVDKDAIERVLTDQTAAWNRGDLDGFMDGYWHDQRLTFTSGDEVEQGWEKTRDNYLKRYWAPGTRPSDRGKLAFEKLQIEDLSPTAAIVRGRFVLTKNPGRESATGRFTLVFRKFEDGWKITSDHTSAAEKKR
jgi:beta-aspartyl-peptidase (threonine type)